jgi:hypothetical protein
VEKDEYRTSQIQRGQEKETEVNGMDNEHKRNTVIGFRLVQMTCVAAIIFGLMWEGGIGLEMRLSQFMILYGVIGALVSELLARLLAPKDKSFRDKAKK